MLLNLFLSVYFGMGVLDDKIAMIHHWIVMRLEGT